MASVERREYLLTTEPLMQFNTYLKPDIYAATNGASAGFGIFLNFQIGLPGRTAAEGLVLVDSRLFAIRKYGVWWLCLPGWIYAG